MFLMSVNLSVAICNSLMFQALSGAWLLWSHYADAEPIETSSLLVCICGSIVLGFLYYLAMSFSYRHTQYNFTDSGSLRYSSEYAPIPVSIPVRYIMKVQPIVVRRFFQPDRVGLRLLLGGPFAYWPFPIIIFTSDEEKLISELKSRNPDVLTTEEVEMLSFKSA